MIENVSTQLTVFHCFAHCLLPGRAFASLYVLLFLEKEAEIGGRDVHHKIQQINTRYKILQKDIAMYLLQSIFFFFSLFLIIIPLILPHLFLLQMSHQIFFLAFSYTIVSTLSQLKKTKKKHFTLTYFMCCLKNIFLVVNASNLIIRIPFERKLKNAINKIYFLAKVSHFLKNDIVKLQNTEKLSFR